jgi:hypothetical protein
MKRIIRIRRQARRLSRHIQLYSTDFLTPISGPSGKILPAKDTPTPAEGHQFILSVDNPPEEVTELHSGSLVKN